MIEYQAPQDHHIYSIPIPSIYAISTYIYHQSCTKCMYIDKQTDDMG